MNLNALAMVVSDGICHQKGKHEEISNVTESSQPTTDKGSVNLVSH